jgi:hypothetical protein
MSAVGDKPVHAIFLDIDGVLKRDVAITQVDILPFLKEGDSYGLKPRLD